MAAVTLRLTTFAAPSRFYALAGACLPWLWAAAALFTVAGLWVGFAIAPTDFQQGEAYRIIFIHVPAAWMSMLIYLVMAFWAAWGWMLNARMASMYAQALAPTGALFTVLALWTGAAWGKPTWGTWWVWDARLTTEFILLLLYGGYIALTAAIDDARDRGAGTLWLGVNQQNERAQRFYRKHGFTISGTKTFRLGDTIENDYVMTR